MDIQKIKEEVLAIVKESTELEVNIDDDMSLLGDMGLSSIEIFVLLGDLEDHFGINIPATQLNSVRTVDDLSRLVARILSRKE